MENKYYIYAHINAIKNEIFYIGKGFGKRAYKKTGRSELWKRTANKYNYIVDILEDGLTEEQAFEREKYYITRIGRRNLGNGPLVNLTDGGEGVSGTIVSEETRKKLSIIHKGKSHSSEHILKIAKANTGKKRTEEQKKQISKGHIGQTAWNKGISKFANEEERLEAKRISALKFKNKNKNDNN